LSTKAEQIEWRRSKIVEMRARGLSQIEIAQELQVSKQSINCDVQYLRKRAKESIKEYVTEHLPEQYQICLSALDTIIKHSFEILKASEDNREKLQAMELFKDTHLVKLELLSNATTIDNALNYITSKQQQEQQSSGQRSRQEEQEQQGVGEQQDRQDQQQSQQQKDQQRDSTSTTTIF
jgi:hypothetical protein